MGDRRRAKRRGLRFPTNLFCHTSSPHSHSHSTLSAVSRPQFTHRETTYAHSRSMKTARHMIRSIALPLTIALTLASQMHHLSEAFQMQMNLPGMVSKKVIVTGAAGRTGSIVFSLLNKDPRFDAVGLVRSEASAKKLIAKTKCSLEEIVVADVTQMEFEKEDENPHPWPYALDGAEAMVICTSAVPQISKVSVIKAMLKIPLNILTPNKKAINFRDLQFKYKPGQYPEMVDYVGQKKQIDLAKKMGVKHGE